MQKPYRVHLLSSEYIHHVYAKAPAIAYSFHELSDEASLLGITAILPGFDLLIQQYFDTGVYFTANKLPYVLDWVHIRGHGRPLKCVNRLLLPEFPYNASSVRSGVIAHKDSACQSMDDYQKWVQRVR
jgi:hypothetical protein